MSKTRTTGHNPPRIQVQGNKGGSYISIIATDVEGMVDLEIGDQCVIMLKHRRVRVTDITRALIDAHNRGWLPERQVEGDLFDYEKDE